MVLSNLVHTTNLVITTKCFNWPIGMNLIAGQIVITDKMEPWLVHITLVGKSLSVEKFGESVATIIGMVNLSNLNGVVGHVVVDDIG